jgi:hypothetical protein
MRIVMDLLNIENQIVFIVFIVNIKSIKKYFLYLINGLLT